MREPRKEPLATPRGLGRSTASSPSCRHSATGSMCCGPVMATSEGTEGPSAVEGPRSPLPQVSSIPQTRPRPETTSPYHQP